MDIIVLLDKCAYAVAESLDKVCMTFVLIDSANLGTAFFSSVSIHIKILYCKTVVHYI